MDIFIHRYNSWEIHHELLDIEYVLSKNISYWKDLFYAHNIEAL